MSEPSAASDLMRIHALGGAVDVRLGDPAIDEQVFRRLWSRCLAPSSPDPRGEADPSTPPVLSLAGSTSLEAATQRITSALIEQRWGELLMLHAGAVTDPGSGRTLAYVAPGGTGKSTLTCLLGQRLGYVTDETVGVAPDTLAVLPYPKPVTWADVAGQPKREHSPESLNLLPTPPKASLARLAVLRRKDGVPASFTQLGMLEALEMVVPETSSLSRLVRPLGLLAEVFERVGGVTLIEYGEAEDIVDWCLTAVAGADSAADQPSPAEPGSHFSRAEPAPDPDGAGTPQELMASTTDPAGAPLVSRSDSVVDMLEADGESAVLQRNRLLRLGPVATAILQLVAAPRSIDELTAALEAQFGPPADGDLAHAVEEQVRTLREHGVVDWDGAA